MYRDKDDDGPDYSAGGGASEDAGSSTEPQSMPDDPAGHDTACHEAPAGRPVSDEEYRRMKEEAGRKKPPSGVPAQTDPSA